LLFQSFFGPLQADVTPATVNLSDALPLRVFLRPLELLNHYSVDVAVAPVGELLHAGVGVLGRVRAVIRGYVQRRATGHIPLLVGDVETGFRGLRAPQLHRSSQGVPGAVVAYPAVLVLVNPEHPPRILL